MVYNKNESQAFKKLSQSIGFIRSVSTHTDKDITDLTLIHADVTTSLSGIDAGVVRDPNRVTKELPNYIIIL